MHGPQLREAILLLKLRLDACDDPNDVVGIQFEIEQAYDRLINLTGCSRERLEAAIDSDYPDWARDRAADKARPPQDPPESAGEA